MRGLIFNIQKYSVQDGPGIRTTVFLKGCPLACAWCHNPEGISPKRELLVVETLCLGCGQCRRACPGESGVSGEPRPASAGAQCSAEAGQGIGDGQWSMADGKGALPARNEGCVLCGACVAACPAEARRMVGEEMSVEQVMAAVGQDRVFYDDSSGGVTFSGGEPLAQFEFLRAALTACRAQGLHTAVDTCGLAPTGHQLAIAPLTDLFLYDLKLMDEARHRQYTGAPNGLILRNLQALGRAHGCIWVRVPLVPGINDQPADLEAIAGFTAGIPGVRQVNLLPFHRTGLQKFARLGQTSPAAEIRPPTPEAVAEAAELFRAHGLAVRAGG